MSLANVLKVFSSIAAVAEPHLSRIMDYKKALVIAEAEKERLEKENRSLKSQLLSASIIAIIFFTAFLITLILFLTK